MERIANNLIIQLIQFYQQHISLHKGYRCAYSALHGHSSCSSWAIRILKKQKLSFFFPLMKRRFQACNQAHEEIKKEKLETVNNSDTVDPCPCANKKTAYCCLGMLPIPWS